MKQRESFASQLEKALSQFRQDNCMQSLIIAVANALKNRDNAALAELTSRAMLEHQAQGRRMGRFPPMGKRPGPDSTWEPDAQEEFAIFRILALRDAGYGLKRIAKQPTLDGLKPRATKWHHTTIRKVLKRHR